MLSVVVLLLYEMSIRKPVAVRFLFYPAPGAPKRKEHFDDKRRKECSDQKRGSRDCDPVLHLFPVACRMRISAFRYRSHGVRTASVVDPEYTGSIRYSGSRCCDTAEKGVRELQPR